MRGDYRLPSSPDLVDAFCGNCRARVPRPRSPGIGGQTGWGRRYDLRIGNLSGDGTRIPIELSSRPIYQEGKVIGVQGIARDISDQRRAREALHRLNETREEEAKRIAHALHDQASQVLTAVHLEVAEPARQLPPPVPDGIRRISTLLRAVEEHLRELSHELRPTILDDLGLVPALRLLIAGISKRSGLPINLMESAGERLPQAIETALYRSIQEALTNVTKQAHASMARVELRQDA